METTPRIGRIRQQYLLIDILAFASDEELTFYSLLAKSCRLLHRFLIAKFQMINSILLASFNQENESPLAIQMQRHFYQGFLQLMNSNGMKNLKLDLHEGSQRKEVWDSYIHTFFKVLEKKRVKEIKLQITNSTCKAYSPFQSLEQLANKDVKLTLGISSFQPFTKIYPIPHFKLIHIDLNWIDLTNGFPIIEADHIHIVQRSNKRRFVQFLQYLKPRESIFFDKYSIGFQELMKHIVNPEILGGKTVRKYVMWKSKESSTKKGSLKEQHNIHLLKHQHITDELNYFKKHYHINIVNSLQRYYYFFLEANVLGSFTNEGVLQFSYSPQMIQRDIKTSQELCNRLIKWATNCQTVSHRRKVESLIFTANEVLESTQVLEAILMGFPGLKSLVISFTNVLQNESCPLKTKIDLLSQDHMKNLKHLEINNNQSAKFLSNLPLSSFCCSLIERCTNLKSLKLVRNHYSLNIPTSPEQLFLPDYLFALKPLKTLQTLTLNFTQKRHPDSSSKVEYEPIDHLSFAFFHTFTHFSLSLSHDEFLILLTQLTTSHRPLSPTLKTVTLDFYQGVCINNQQVVDFAKCLRGMLNEGQRVEVRTNLRVHSKAVMELAGMLPEVAVECEREFIEQVGGMYWASDIEIYERYLERYE
ncbi:hypothetical protein FGO68_gene10864 [Halteria grandinella]|uniref:Uncharacterized protein n=1 Tax=Halteria grandinella TaxID=5974 RepID=A0A8J8T531_HALGN|nr:hypothetical protein FGO68_gene10864 [Halteria grandinella]